MKQRRRVRPLLLALLWVWAGCIALVLDLFWNVGEFDGVRPDNAAYRATRYAAHRIVGEPYREQDQFARAELVGAAPRSAARPLEAVQGGMLDPGRYRAGPKPGAATPAGQRLLDGLARAARTSSDPERRIAALRSMAHMFRGDARNALLRGQEDADPAVREAAAAFLEETK